MQVRRIFSLGIIGAGLIVTSQIASAATPQLPNGITVSPAYQQVQIPAGEAEQELDFSITNHRPSAETIQLSSQDFNSLSDSGGLFFVGTNPTQLQKKYGLAQWLSIPQSTVNVAPGQTVTVKASILNQPTLSPGGHYGALMLALQDGSTAGGHNRVALHPVASSLLFVNKVGGDTHRLKLADVEVSHSIWKLPSAVTLRFYNDGNTHVIPRGTITIVNAHGTVVKQGIINENSELILPQLYRKMTVPLTNAAAANDPGHYKLIVNFRFDGYDQFRTYRTSLFLATPGVFIALLVLAAITLVVLRYYRQLWLSHRPAAAKAPTPRKSAKKATKISVSHDD